MGKRRRRRMEELEREPEHPAKPKLAELDPAKRASVMEELQSAGGNRALQHVAEGAQLQREAAPKVSQWEDEDRTFMYVDGIQGPVTEKAHAGAFEILSYELDMKAQEDTSGYQARSRRQYSDVVVIIRKSSALPLLRQALVQNQVISSIKFVGLETTILKDAAVVGIRNLPDGRVQISFSFKNIAWEYGDKSFEDQRTKQQ